MVLTSPISCLTAQLPSLSLEGSWSLLGRKVPRITVVTMLCATFILGSLGALFAFLAAKQREAEAAAAAAKQREAEAAIKLDNSLPTSDDDSINLEDSAILDDSTLSTFTEGSVSTGETNEEPDPSDEETSTVTHYQGFPCKPKQTKVLKAAYPESHKPFMWIRSKLKHSSEEWIGSDQDLTKTCHITTDKGITVGSLLKSKPKVCLKNNEISVYLDFTGCDCRKAIMVQVEQEKENNSGEKPLSRIHISAPLTFETGWKTYYIQYDETINSFIKNRLRFRKLDTNQQRCRVIFSQVMKQRSVL